MTLRIRQPRQAARSTTELGTRSRRFSGARSKRARDRRALLLMTVLVCLAVVMTLAAAWLKTIALEHQHVRAAADGVQTEFLALSGLDRATARLTADPDYGGETWQLDERALQARAGATIVIHVAVEPNRPSARRVRVVAEFPDIGPQRARRTQESTIELPIVGEAS